MTSAGVGRLAGLDLARTLALIGMVVVNFDVVMVPIGADGIGLAQVLQGRAAATFVVLAGVGFGLAVQRAAWAGFALTTLKRAAFLLLLGLLNTLIFPADIIHYYAFYFVAALALVRLPSSTLWAAIGTLTFGFVILLLLFDYDRGWNWQTYEYADLWSVSGFVRNLLFNGWHPLVPWLAFFLFGVILARSDLRDQTVQRRCLVVGVTVTLTASLSALALGGLLRPIDPELALLMSAAPVPPMPLYMVAGGGAAAAAIGGCLLFATRVGQSPWLAALSLPGRQALTQYIAHILIGVGALTGLGLIGNATHAQALLAAFLYCLLMWVGALAWSRWLGRGPLESLMRKICG